MPLDSAFHDRFLHEIQDLYDAEHQILDALPAMIEGASHAELKTALSEHREQTENHVSRLEQVFESVEAEPKRRHCDGMAGLLKEGEKVLDEGDLPAAVRDAAIIAACQKVEHYEIAGYGTVAAWAELMEHDEAHELLGETLDEEKEADERLGEIAEIAVNVEAEEE